MNRHYVFAGGGTGGHIYPMVAVAQRLREREPDCGVTFFCSERNIDKHILGKVEADFIELSAVGFSLRPLKLIKFVREFRRCTETVERFLRETKDCVVISCGGYVSGPVVCAASKANVPVYMVNVDAVPGKANKLMCGCAKKIFVQFEDTASRFGKCKDKVIVSGCPVRAGIGTADRDEVIEKLGLDRDKFTLLVTGASSGSANINNAVGRMLDKMGMFEDSWQIIHLTGREHLNVMKDMYADFRITSKIIDYYDEMGELLAAADLLIGRAGAVSVAEYAVSGVPSICMPYPYHRDNHQRVNAEQLANVGAAVIVEDKCDAEANVESLWGVLSELMNDEGKRIAMSNATMKVAVEDASRVIADTIIEMEGKEQ